MRYPGWLLLLVLVGTTHAACQLKQQADSVPAATATVGPAGGVATLADGPTVSIPAGALSGSTDVTITLGRSDRVHVVPGALSPVYQFGPDGTVFTSPVTVKLPVPAGTQEAVVYWTKPGSTELEVLPATIEGSAAVVQVLHFSMGFVAPQVLACGTGTCPAGFHVTGVVSAPSCGAGPDPSNAFVCERDPADHMFWQCWAEGVTCPAGWHATSYASNPFCGPASTNAMSCELTPATGFFAQCRSPGLACPAGWYAASYSPNPACAAASPMAQTVSCASIQANRAFTQCWSDGVTCPAGWYPSGYQSFGPCGSGSPSSQLCSPVPSGGTFQLCAAFGARCPSGWHNVGYTSSPMCGDGAANQMTCVPGTDCGAVGTWSTTVIAGPCGTGGGAITFTIDAQTASGGGTVDLSGQTAVFDPDSCSLVPSAQGACAPSAGTIHWPGNGTAVGECAFGSTSPSYPGNCCRVTGFSCTWSRVSP